MRLPQPSYSSAEGIVPNRHCHAGTLRQPDTHFEVMLAAWFPAQRKPPEPSFGAKTLADRIQRARRYVNPNVGETDARNSSYLLRDTSVPQRLPAGKRGKPR